MTYSKQVDVLDLLIHTLMEHEKRLDELIRKMEDALNEPC